MRRWGIIVPLELPRGHSTSQVRAYGACVLGFYAFCIDIQRNMLVDAQFCERDTWHVTAILERVWGRCLYVYIWMYSIYIYYKIYIITTSYSVTPVPLDFFERMHAALFDYLPRHFLCHVSRVTESTYASLGIGGVELLRFFNIASTAYFCFFFVTCHVSRSTKSCVRTPQMGTCMNKSGKFWKIFLRL